MDQIATQSAAREFVALVVNDDDGMRDTATRVLKHAGFSTIAEADSDTAVTEVQIINPDVVLVGNGNGDGSEPSNGRELCRQIREISEIPIIFLAPALSEVEALSALQAGADTYLVCDVSPFLLEEQVRAVLRRAGRPLDTDNVIKIRSLGIEIDIDARETRVNGTPIELTKTQFELLTVLAEHPRRVMTREQLIARIWGPWYSSDHLLDVHISRLRAVIQAAGGPRVPEAMRGVGFRLEH
jgi:two-component system alkaline phosphatase synthesis response regulator PhoP